MAHGSTEDTFSATALAPPRYVVKDAQSVGNMMESLPYTDILSSSSLRAAYLVNKRKLNGQCTEAKIKVPRIVAAINALKKGT
jgi:hypothetical protein